MAPTAQLLTGKAYAPRLYPAQEGNRGVSHYLVSSVVPGVALTATGLPAIGDPYGTDLPGAYLRRLETEPLGGGSASPADPDQNGWSLVRATYEPPEQTGITPDLSSWTEVIQSTRSERIFYPIDPATGLPEIGATKLRGGDGATVMSGWTEVSVHTFHLTSPSPALLAYILNTLTRPCKVNDAGIVLPRYGAPGSFGTLALGPGQALYLSHSLGESSPGVMRLSHHMAISKDFLDRYATDTETGESDGVETSVLYDEASFVGLW